MKPFVIAIAVLVLLVGLLQINTIDSANSGIEDRGGYGTTCLNGVTYYDGHYLLAPAYNIDGTLIACGE